MTAPARPGRRLRLATVAGAGADSRLQHYFRGELAEHDVLGLARLAKA